jgi:enamine deaminase RidA (YjgF/YER057c/UK114 family)
MKAKPPTVTFMFVAGLANPDYLIEIEAVAAVSAGGK